MTALVQRLAWIAATAGLLGGLLVLDAFRGGPATPLSRCNLALSRSAEPPADVLVVGSSRTGVAVDPITMERMLGEEPDLGQPTVERIALGRNPLRANVALLENYLSGRGDPAVIVVEISFLTERSVERIDDLGSGLTADEFLYRRDANLMSYRQILGAPAVAMPYSEPETGLTRLRWALRGAVLRSGALAYQFARDPGNRFSLDDCDAETWTREDTWPADFAFIWNEADEADEVGRPAERVASLRAEVATGATGRDLQDWQLDLLPTGRVHAEDIYPYDVDEPYRAGEVALLDRAVELATEREIPVVLLPLPLYGTRPDTEDLASLEARFDGAAEVYDLYGSAGVDLSTYWYDDAHLEVSTAGELTTALLAQHLVDGLPAGAGDPADRTSERWDRSAQAQPGG